MSELAKNEFGDEWTAFEVKDEYLCNRTEFRWFVCAFCETPVSPAATYGDHYVKAPYFTLADKKKPHADACPYGKATLAQYGIDRSTPRATHAFEVELPERLIAIRTRRPGGRAGTAPQSSYRATSRFGPACGRTQERCK